MKRICALLLVLVCLLLSACAASEDQQSPTTAEPSASAVPDDYLTWTQSDWNRATDEQKTGAARFVLFQIGDAFLPNFSEYVEEAEADPSMESQLNEGVESLKDEISSYFEEAGSDATIGDMTEAVQALADQALQE